MLEFYFLGWRLGLRWFVRGLNFSRAIEYPAAWRAVQPLDGCRVLDLGSAPFSTWPLHILRQSRCKVCLADLDSHVRGHVDNLTTLRRSVGIKASFLGCVQQDARHLGFEDESFDRITSISVVEHIPDRGDESAMGEIGRILAPGGRALITVPFGPEYSEKWFDSDSLPRAVPLRAGFPSLFGSKPAEATSNGSAFFERVYDLKTLNERLIRPSGLRLEKLTIWGERGFPLLELLERRHPLLKAATNWAIPFLASHLLRPLRPSQVRHESIAVLLLKR